MAQDIENKENLKKIQKILDIYKICDRCIGRLFRKIDYNSTNEEKGKKLRKKIQKNKIDSENCFLCENIFSELNHFVNLIYDSLKKYEFDNFLIGVKLDEDLLEKENKIFTISDFEYKETIKTELKRKIGCILEEKLGKEVNFDKPNITAVIDTQFDVVNLQIESLYIYGRYKKFSRNLPQTKWFCKICRGKGCRRCNYTGKLYERSVEELISEKLLKKTKSEDESFHGAGREDIDVRMLGNGRPFVLELKNPQKRKIDLENIKKEINKKYKDFIEISNIEFTNKETIKDIKQSNFKKTYKVIFKCRNSINIEKLKRAIKSLQGKTIKQKTPSRVAHRRADMVREKYIYKCKIESVEGSIATIVLKAESGTYIKELVSGDDNRTIPNISNLINKPCEVIELDVIKINEV
jgi:tRNA pseudouridine synthase 10